VTVHLSVRIGEPVDRPWTGVQVILPRGMSIGDVEPAIAAVVEAELGRMAAFRDELIRGEHPVC
jgi:S-adenosylmethionine synthetase